MTLMNHLTLREKDSCLWDCCCQVVLVVQLMLVVEVVVVVVQHCGGEKSHLAVLSEFFFQCQHELFCPRVEHV